MGRPTRRGNSLSLSAAGRKLGEWEAPGQADAVELWLTPTQLLLRRNGKTVYMGPNPCPSATVSVSLGGGARKLITRNEVIRFDNLEVAWLTQADFLKVLK